MIKLFVSDIDGTFLNEEHKIAPETKETYFELAKSGVEILFASGRNYAGIKMINDSLGAQTACIALNGAEYRDAQGNCKILKEISKESKSQLLGAIMAHSNSIEIYTDEKDYTNCKLDVIFDQYLSNMIAIGQEKKDAEGFLTALQLESFMHEMDAIEDVWHKKIIKIELHHNNEIEKQQMMTELSKIEGVQISTSVPVNVEITKTGATKGELLEELIALKGYSKEEVVVIGDSGNDISMLTLFPNSVAMGNASEAIKECANYVCESNENHGCAQVMKGILIHNQNVKEKANEKS